MSGPGVNRRFSHQHVTCLIKCPDFYFLAKPVVSALSSARGGRLGGSISMDSDFLVFLAIFSGVMGIVFFQLIQKLVHQILLLLFVINDIEGITVNILASKEKYQ